VGHHYTQTNTNNIPPAIKGEKHEPNTKLRYKIGQNVVGTIIHKQTQTTQ